MEKFPITVEGYAALQAEYKHLQTTVRKEIVEAIAEARAHGDLSENAEYHAAREKQSFNEGRIMELAGILARAQVIDVSELSGKTVKFGAKLKVVDDESEQEFIYKIVSEYEADLKLGLIAYTAPIARAFIGKNVDDSVEVHTPKGVKYYTILEVEYS